MASLHHLTTLLARASDNSTDVKECARPLTDDVGDPIFGTKSFTAHHLMILICAPCVGLTILSSLFLSWKHLHGYVAPQEQRQILRIVNMPVAYCIFNFLALLWIKDYFYIDPISGIYEAFAVAALFLLYLEYCCPDGTDREAYFTKLPGVDKKGNPTGGGSLQWFQRTWASILQYPLSKLVLTVIQIVTQFYGVYCENSFSPKDAHVWLFVIDLLFVGGALGACLKFARRMGKENAIAPQHKGKGKTYSFIGIIIFQIIQDLIFGLMNGKLFKPSKTVTYNDINFGIPSTLTCVESVIFSLVFHWSFSAKEYAEGQRMDRYGGQATRISTFKAIFDALNPSDIIAGTIVAIQLLFMRVQSRYGARSGSQQEKIRESGVGMEPLSNRRRMRGYSGGSAFDDDHLTPPPPGTEYEGGMHGPAMPPNVRDPSPQGRAGPGYGRGEYQPLTRSREPSPSGQGQQYPRQMV